MDMVADSLFALNFKKERVLRIQAGRFLLESKAKSYGKTGDDSTSDCR